MQTKTALNGERCLYLYGVVASHSIEPNRLRTVEDASGVFLVHTGNLACVASSVRVADYRDQSQDIPPNQPKNQLGNCLEWLAPRVMRHHEMIRNLHEITTVVPFKFGTLCASASQAQEILQQLRQPLTRLLGHFDGREEWGVRVVVDQAATMRSIEEMAPELIALRKSAAEQSPGEVYFLQKRRQKLAAALVQELVFSLSDNIEQRLEKCAVQIVRNASVAGERDKSKLAVLSAAILINRNRLESLEAILEQVESECSRYGLATELSGPWPPYSFSTDLHSFQNSASGEVAQASGAS